jgi:hypothetical protein
VELTGAGADTYSWSPSAGLSTDEGAEVIASPIVTTTYTLTGTSNSCSSVAEITITVNPFPTVTITPTTATICSGESVELTGAGADTYSWTPSEGLSADEGAVVTASPIETTTYTLTGTSNSCSSVAEITITVNPTPSVVIAPSSPSICVGESVELTASGADTYNWTPTEGLSADEGAEVTASPNATTTYTVTGTTGSCSSSADVTITVNPFPTVTITPTTATICSGESVELTGAGADTYSWTPSEGLSADEGAVVTASPIETTTYTLTGTSNSCSSVAEITINVNPTPSVVIAPSSPSICVGESVELTASGADTYNWTPTEGLSADEGAVVTASPNATTTYTVTGTIGSCSSSTEVTITVNPFPTVTITPTTATICSGESVELTGVGADTYSWSPSAGLSSDEGAVVTASPSETTTYSLTGITNSCSSVAEITITVNPSPFVVIAPSSSSICEGESVELTASGADSYSWSPSASLSAVEGAVVTASPNATSTYTVTGTTGACSRSSEVTITVIPTPNLTIFPASTTICNGLSANLTASGATTYSWSPSESLSSASGAQVIASPTVNTIYTVVGSTGNCTATKTVLVNVSPTPVITINAESNNICRGESTVITASGANTYNWFPIAGLNTNSGSTVTATPNQSTTYSVSGAIGSCSSQSTITINVTPFPVIQLNIPQPAICLGDSIELTASGAANFQWSPADFLSTTTGNTVIANPGQSKTYTITGTTNNCVSELEFNLIVNDYPVVSVSAAANEICAGESVALTASGANQYIWTPSASLSSSSGASVSASPTETTTYIVTGTSNNCSTTSEIGITVFPVPQLLINPSNIIICEGESQTIEISGADNISWNPQSGISFVSNNTYLVNPETSINFQITGANGICVSNGELPVTVNKKPVADFSSEQTFLTNVEFTNLSTDGTSFFWDFSEGTSEEDNPTFGFTFDGTYPVTLIAENECGSDTITKQVVVLKLNISEFNTENILIYPNPAKDILVIQSGGVQIQNISIFNSIGQKLMDLSMGFSSKTEFNISSLPIGIYYLHIMDKQSSSIFKFIKN